MMINLVMMAFAINGIAHAWDVQRGDPKPIQWTGGVFDWPCETTKSLYKSTGRYIPKNIIATKIVMYKNDLILALPRFKPGVPVTLAKMSVKYKHGCPSSLLEAFSCWSLQEEGNCAAFQSVVDIFLDAQEVLWVLDSGVVNSLEAEPIRRCSPKVVAIDLKTRKIVKTVDLQNLTTPLSRLQNVIADYSHDGRAFVYVTDAATRSILVYDVTLCRGYRVILPKAVTNGCGKRDVLYANLIRRADGTTCLIFTYLSSPRMFSINTTNLQNGATCGKIQDLGPKPKKMVMLGTDNGSAIFFRYEGESNIYRWDSRIPFLQANFQKVSSGHECMFATSVTSDYKRGRMRVLESNFPDFIQGTVGCGANQAVHIL